MCAHDAGGRGASQGHDSRGPGCLWLGRAEVRPGGVPPWIYEANGPVPLARIPARGGAKLAHHQQALSLSRGRLSLWQVRGTVTRDLHLVCKGEKSASMPGWCNTLKCNWGS